MKTECSDLKMSELSPNTTCPLCQGDVGSGDIVSIGEKGANRINKACVERGDDIHLTAGTGVQSYTNKELIYKNNKTKCVAMASQGTHPQNITDFDFLTYDSTFGDGSPNTTSDSLNDTFVNVHFQQHEYDHDGGQNVQSDAMLNIDPDNHFHASISTDTKYYSDEQFVRDVKSKGDLSFIHFNARSLNKNLKKIKDSIDDLKLSFDIIAISETWAETDTIAGFTLN